MVKVNPKSHHISQVRSEMSPLCSMTRKLITLEVRDILGENTEFLNQGIHVTNV
jgi:hypothetical protein